MNMEIDSRIVYEMAEERLAAGATVKICFGGESMLPTLSKTDSVILAPIDGEPRVGDVLFFHYHGMRVVHRLVGREGDYYIMQGDNNYATERVLRSDLLARLQAVERQGGRLDSVDSRQWRRISRWAYVRKMLKNTIIRHFSKEGRRHLRIWYFAVLAFLMWAPLNGLGLPLDNYILGLRADHLLHAAVFLPCALFLKDLFRRRQNLFAWLSSIGVGLLTEYVQYLLPWRGFDVNDLVANALGVTLGWMLMMIVLRKRSPQIHK